MKHLLTFLAVVVLLWSCGSTQKIKTGDQAFEQKSYAIAANLYKSEFNTEPVEQYKAQKAFRIATSYQALNNTKDAEKWYAEALKQNYPDVATRYYLATMLMANEKYDAAITEFKNMPTKTPLIK